MVRKGSSVRVRQRAFCKVAAKPTLRRGGGLPPSWGDVHETSIGVHAVEQGHRVVDPVSGEVTVGAVDVDGLVPM
jgi:hypothetical protein